MDYATLSPEVNSARMYAGPGAGTLLAAALSWDGLAAELSSAASDYGLAIADMASGPWRGPASAAMAGAAAPYVGWLRTTAAQALRAAGQAKAAAGAYAAAFAMTVPPPVIATNRALLASLVATNLFGQNTPAIAATEAQYGEMWAQDAAAMYGYAASSAAASRLTPFGTPPPTTGAQAAALSQLSTNSGIPDALSQFTSAVPTALQGLASPAGALGLQGTAMVDWFGMTGADLSTPAGLLNFLTGSDGSPLGGALSSVGFNILSSGFYTPGNFLGTLADAVSMQGEAAEAAAAAAGSAASDLGASVGGIGGAMSAGVGNAASIGSLSVPSAWTGTSPLGAVASALPNAGAGATTVTEAPSSMLGGLPLSGLPGRGFSEAPRYGFRPTVVVHPPAAG
ncbi:PPE family protein [Mycobacterium angelicum]|uniref:PPE family protein n=1 Tax=Mycobacterium angelicum TaxID=470074 RepID=A0A1X0A712_MYCAN|nr:PPE family protein [Mycobacterium angelicum]MCV7197096.1 PPE family protein [Mycobacterium angelicum]ORA25446.1 hypothetical protein BST12_03350 [Mycobacterium angelicum]